MDNAKWRVDNYSERALDLREGFSDRDCFLGAVDEGGVFITDFYKSRITGILCITAPSPIFDEAGT